jgi:DNA-binding TFAR19-related protein (PDSD5 family)
LSKAPQLKAENIGKIWIKTFRKHTFPTAYMMAILHPLKLSRLNGLDLVRKNFAKNVLEFVVFIFVSYIHHIFKINFHEDMSQ